MSIMTTIYAPGARKLSEARNWVVDGHGVYVTVTEDGMAQLHLRGLIVAERPAVEVEAGRGKQQWAMDYLAAEQAEADLAATIEHMDAAETAVTEVQAAGAAKLAEAAELDAAGAAPVTIVRMRNGRPSGRREIPASDPRHPASRSAALRAEGARLATWTFEDEFGYTRYVSNGLAATDGWFAPLDRAAWALSA